MGMEAAGRAHGDGVSHPGGVGLLCPAVGQGVCPQLSDEWSYAPGTFGTLCCVLQL